MNWEKIADIISELETIKRLIKIKKMDDADKKYKKLLNDEKYKEILSSWKTENMSLENIENLQKYLINLTKNMPSIPISDSDFTPSAPNFSLVNVPIPSAPSLSLFDDSNWKLVFRNINQLVNPITKNKYEIFEKMFLLLKDLIEPSIKGNTNLQEMRLLLQLLETRIKLQKNDIEKHKDKLSDTIFNTAFNEVYGFKNHYVTETTTLILSYLLKINPEQNQEHLASALQNLQSKTIDFSQKNENFKKLLNETDIQKLKKQYEFYSNLKNNHVIIPSAPPKNMVRDIEVSDTWELKETEINKESDTSNHVYQPSDEWKSKFSINTN